jgi:hypothetical protein
MENTWESVKKMTTEPYGKYWPVNVKKPKISKSSREMEIPI